jgi:hypothetical protein
VGADEKAAKSSAATAKEPSALAPTKAAASEPSVET